MENKSLFSYGYVRALVTILLVAGIVALSAYAHLTLRQAKFVFSGPTMISVTGTGEILAKPDIGQFSFAVQAEGADAAAAQSASAEAINEVMTYLEEVGVDEADIKTQNYNLNPKYRYEERVCTFGSYCPPGQQILDGYEVYQSIQVKVRDLDTAGELISGVGEHGATNISGLQFTIDDTETLQADARAKAIENAQEKAKELARDLGVRIVRMSSFWEQNNDSYYAPRAYGMGGEEASFDMAAPSVPTGENTITSRVDISYEVE